MNVLLIGNYAPDDQASMAAFSRVLEAELPRLQCAVRVIHPQRRVLRVPPTSRWWKWLGYVDKFILFIPSIGRHLGWADVVHICDHSNGMYVRWVRRKPNVITCHDVIAVQAARGMIEGWHVSSTGRLFQRLISQGLAKADLIACVSHLTRRALLDLNIVDERRVTTTLNGLNGDFHPVAGDEAHRLVRRFGIGPGDRFLLHVGSDLARKNRRKVMETFITLQQRAQAGGAPAPADRLVFVGHGLSPEMAGMADSAGLRDRVTSLMDVSHEELRAIYSMATALVFPSLQEGFGWPVIEAQACGCPVFASDLAPMNEIGGAGAVYIDPTDSTAMAQAIERAAPRFDEMRRLGLDNASHYSSQQMARAYLADYRRVIDERHARA